METIYEIYENKQYIKHLNSSYYTHDEAAFYHD